ncbi:hypothetical protein [Georgenia daeguensis]|uniref:Uncharacterized protein n=1 Tax=Georgenia daeguensis TaxID=908355 RepID=A0ABP6UNQ5_9MICO
MQQTLPLDNPAARLHALLTALQKQESAGRPIMDAWAAVLGANRASINEEMAGVAALLNDLKRVVERIDDPTTTQMYRHYMPEWSRSVLSPGSSWGAGSNGLVDVGALATLGGLATLLSVMGSEGSIPDEQSVADLRESLESALAEVRADGGLPPEVRRLLVARLHDMLWAIDHLNVMGPEGVKAAAERLAGAVAVSSDLRRSGPVVTKVLEVAGRLWTAFTFPGQVGEAIEGWNQVKELLPSA